MARRTTARQKAQAFQAESEANLFRLLDQSFGETLFGISGQKRLARRQGLGQLEADQAFATQLKQEGATLQERVDAAGSLAGLMSGVNPGSMSQGKQMGLGVRLSEALQPGSGVTSSQAATAAAEGLALLRGTPLTANQAQTLITNQQTKFLQKMEAPAQVMDAYQQIEGALGTGDALGTQAALIKLAKILDPTSVVREGEVTTIEGGLGIGNQLMNAFNRAMNEGAPEQAADAIRAVAREVAVPVLGRALQARSEFAKSLDDVLGDEFPGIGRITDGIGISWGDVASLVQGGPVTGKIVNPETGESVNTVSFSELQAR